MGFLERERKPLHSNAKETSKLVATTALAVILILNVLSMQLPLVTAAELHVGSGQTYTTIQAAINDATDGDTIIVHPGTYNEVITINKGLRIIGAGADTTIIKGASNPVP
ncbi:MAG: hypothetical protein QXN62_08475, partial [Candidatus Bathyarchaeia archaeon]